MSITDLHLELHKDATDDYIETGEAVVESERSTFALVVIFVLGLMGLHLICVVTSYILCLYRFFMVWSHIFRINRMEQEWRPNIPATAPYQSVQQALVTKIYDRKVDRASEGDAACPICLVDLDDGDLASHGKHCQHTFHNGCITQWLYKQPSCPCCRQDIIGCIEPDSVRDDTFSVFEYLKLSIAFAGLS